jgi:hypothetical protein
MQENIEECVKDFDAKQAQLCLMADLIGERKQELNALSQNFAKCTMELKTEEKECRALKKINVVQVERLESEKKLLKVLQFSKNDPRAQSRTLNQRRSSLKNMLRNLS